MLTNLLIWAIATVAVATCIVLVWNNCIDKTPKMVYIITMNNNIYATFDNRDSAVEVMRMITFHREENREKYKLHCCEVYSKKSLDTFEQHILY